MKKQLERNIQIPQNIILFNSSMPQIGYISRTSTLGKEFDMVNKYIEFLIKKYSKCKSKKAAIFIEPQIDTGYPDIVIVEFYSVPDLSWDKTRNGLTTTDFKILFYIQKQKKSSTKQISDILGFPTDVVRKSLLRLFNCGLIYLSDDKNNASNVDFRRYCRINKIIAIEAKIDKWNEAIRQANNNIWFSTESYILLNKDSCSSTIIDTCSSDGLGIILVNGKIQTTLASTKRCIPVSYASILFNEWILRWIHTEETDI